MFLNTRRVYHTYIINQLSSGMSSSKNLGRLVMFCEKYNEIFLSDMEIEFFYFVVLFIVI